MVHVPDRAVPGDRSDGRLSAGCEQKLGRRDQTADAENDEGIRSQILADSFHVVRVAATLLHPFAPEGTEMVREYLGVDERLWDWAYIFEPLSAFTATAMPSVSWSRGSISSASIPPSSAPDPRPTHARSKAR